MAENQADRTEANERLLRTIVSISSTVIIGLIAALWLNLNQEISDLKASSKGLEVAVNDLRGSLQEMRGRYDKLVDIFNSTAKKH